MRKHKMFPWALVVFMLFNYALTTAAVMAPVKVQALINSVAPKGYDVDRLLLNPDFFVGLFVSLITLTLLGIVFYKLLFRADDDGLMSENDVKTKIVPLVIGMALVIIILAAFGVSDFSIPSTIGLKPGYIMGSWFGLVFMLLTVLELIVMKSMYSLSERVNHIVEIESDDTVVVPRRAI